LITALLLRLAGVPHNEIASDYAVSEEHLRPATEAYIASAADDADRAFRVRLTATPAEAMRAVLTTLEDRYGSVAAYLRAAGLAEPEVARAGARLRANVARPA
jgi:protein tyrosine/serine phosphatase